MESRYIKHIKKKDHAWLPANCKPWLQRISLLHIWRLKIGAPDVISLSVWRPMWPTSQQLTVNALLYPYCLTVDDTCDFETGLCNWKSVKQDTSPSRRYRRSPSDNQYVWGRVRGDSVSATEYRAKIDHTTQSSSGKWINWRELNEVVPCLETNGALCLNFSSRAIFLLELLYQCYHLLIWRIFSYGYDFNLLLLFCRLLSLSWQLVWKLPEHCWD